VRGGERIAIAIRHAVLGDGLVHLETELLEAFRAKSPKSNLRGPARRASSRLRCATSSTISRRAWPSVRPRVCMFADVARSTVQGRDEIVIGLSPAARDCDRLAL
jgi:hypothetical protein